VCPRLCWMRSGPWKVVAAAAAGKNGAGGHGTRGQRKGPWGPHPRGAPWVGVRRGLLEEGRWEGEGKRQ